MRHSKPMSFFRALAILVVASLLTECAAAERDEPKAERIGDGTLLSVLPPDAIPAVDNPQFVSAAKAEKFMRDKEPVLGLYDGKVAKAYSLWQLDHHEIVNDSTPAHGPIAVTW